MSEALAAIFDDDRSYEQSRITPQSRPASHNELPTQYSAEDARSLFPSPPRDPRDILGISRTMPSLAEMTPGETVLYLSTGEVPARMQAETDYDDDQDVMEWKPLSSQYRAFQPARAPRQPQLFSQAPVGPDQSLLWYKGLPPAPISPAHKVRNPPNVPRLQAPSQEAKKNFFDRFTGRHPNSSWSEGTAGLEEEECNPVKPRHEIEFAQQKLFLPNPPDVANGLSEMFEQAFTLKSSEDEDRHISQKSSESERVERRRHVFTALVLLVALLGWNFTLSHSELDMMMVPLGIMVACAGTALRSVADCIITWSKHNSSLLNAFGVILAGAQTVASGFGISEIMAGRTYCTTCRFRGALLIGVMLVQEICFVAFSGRMNGKS